MDSVNQDREWYKYLTNWVVFGSMTAKTVTSLHLISVDINNGNVVNSKDRVVIIDYGGITKIRYPEQWRDICLSLMSLFSWLDADRLAAFRFGYLHTGGVIAKIVFEELRVSYGLNAFKDTEQFEYEHLSEKNDINIEINLTDTIILEDRSWIELRDKKLRYGSICNGGKILRDHIKQWRSQRESIELSSKERLQADEYHYLKHFVAAYLSGNRRDFLEAVLNLHGICALQSKILSAVGYLFLAKKIYQWSEKYLSGSIFEKWINEASKCASSYYENNVRDVDVLFNNKGIQNNLYHFIWCCDDLEEGNIVSNE